MPVHIFISNKRESTHLNFKTQHLNIEKNKGGLTLCEWEIFL